MKLPKAMSSRGADFGRVGKQGPAELAYKFHLELVRIDAGGYDSGGAYWGLGQPLFTAWDDVTAGNRVDLFLRSTDRETAKAKIRETYPAAKFYR